MTRVDRVVVTHKLPITKTANVLRSPHCGLSRFRTGVQTNFQITGSGRNNTTKSIRVLPKIITNIKTRARGPWSEIEAMRRTTWL